ncbi:Undecaprenyl-diphosphatase [Planktothrix sp. PCC 11201]|uniref:undecaprenyl-diphosphate phosphatase n=1 Tax=Planktothrix sp. PCC 11201 TaxID=1729650 RepID=UPI000916D2EE|nr:undecaprenyl-diphosphate phosphatase [Planktothrix sp. PCC 11201]SKB11884.1 Undecaprenyl-diphosphatase [Planktothrix sp. PCC 11201]
MFSTIYAPEYWTDLFRNLAINNLLIQAPPAPEVATQINILQAFFLGLIQGITEFLPISSTAHLKVIPVLLGWGDPGSAFTAIIQLGSIAAVVWFFWRDLTQVVKGFWQAIQKKDYDSLDFRLALGVILGTIPIVFFGFLVKVLIPDYDNSPLRSMGVIGTASIVMAFLLGLAEKIGSRKRDFEHLIPRDGILMGLAQTLALIPGVSRSGSTITAGLFLGLERATAARFSFLLGIPAITLAGIVELKAVFVDGIGNIQIFPLLVGLISATIFSYLSIAWLIQYLQKKSTWIFVWYRLAFGVAILTAVLGGALKNI